MLLGNGVSDPKNFLEVFDRWSLVEDTKPGGFQAEGIQFVVAVTALEWPLAGGDAVGNHPIAVHLLDVEFPAG